MKEEKFLNKTNEIGVYYCSMTSCPRCNDKLLYNPLGGEDGFNHFHVNCTSIKCNFKIDVSLVFSQANDKNDNIWEYDRDTRNLDCHNYKNGTKIEFPLYLSI